MTTVGRSSSVAALQRRYSEVQLATLVDEPPEGAQWVHEIKFDGYRLLGFLARGVVALRTRNGQDWTAKFPSLTSSLQNMKTTGAVLDMEAVILDSKGRSSFQALQAALGDSGRRAAIVAYVFDLLYLDGRDLTKLPLRERKQLLQVLLDKSKRAAALRYSEHFETSGRQMLDSSCRMELEGIVSKDANGPYVPGRSRSWLKSKCSHRQEFIIVGYSDARKGERSLGALYLGYHDNGAIKYAGKVGTGFSMQSARELADRLERIAAKKPVLSRADTRLPAREWEAVHWVMPKLLGEVAFTEWTQDGQLRHPSFQGLREDKNAAGVIREKS
jgi:bifunctional non-homologous end joining protein LigD